MPCREYKRVRWPNPLQKSYNLGLLPFVKRFRVRLEFTTGGFAPSWFGGHTLHHFSALTNLQELGMDSLNISASCHRFNSTLDTSHRPFDSSPSQNPKVLADRSCISLDSSQTFKISKSTISSKGRKRTAPTMKRLFPSPYPHCEDV